MKILFIPEWYPTSTTPFAGSFNFELVKTIRVFADVDVITIRYVKNIRFNDILLKRNSSQHCEYEYHTGFSPIPGTTKFFIKRLFAKVLKQYFKVCGIPDIIHTQDSTAYYVIRAIDFIGISIPIVVSQHWTIFLHALVNKITIKRFNYIFQHCKYVLPALKDASVHYSKFNLRAETRWLPNSIDINIFRWKNEPRNKWITHISGFTAQKRVEDVIYSFAEVFKEHQDYTLHLIGDGIDRSHYELLTTKVLPKHSYFFHGFLSKQEISDHLNKSSCFVFPSTHETFGCVLLEAAACQCPIVTTRVGGIQYVLDPDDAIFVEALNVKEIANGIRNVIEGRTNINYETVERKIKSRFSTASVAGILEDIYIDAING
jgi:glycosyltransferase involved in cell wall biosynthesis